MQVIVSQWTWAATLLQSSNQASQYGIAGPFWYAAGATIQILLFGILAIEIKKKAPNMHTFLEMVDIRWGKTAHLTFLFFGISTNLIVTGMLLQGGSAVMTACSGMHPVAANFLIPLGVVLYTWFGGLKATFLASYIHTAVIMICLVVFITYVYAVPGDYECDALNGLCTSGYKSAECTEDHTKQCEALGSAAILWERLAFLTALPRMGTATPEGGLVGTVGTDEVNMRTDCILSDGTTCPLDSAVTRFDSGMPQTITCGCSGATPWLAGESVGCATGYDSATDTYSFNHPLGCYSPGDYHHGPVCDNRGGSFITMLSMDGLMFGIINIVGNFGTVFVDQSYWQSAIAARPSAAHKGYLLGGMVWFTIPMALATALGLSSLALNVKMPSSEAGSGLAPPAAAIVLLGKGGGIMIVLMLFMAITSTGSAECIAVGSLLAYDVYRKYVKPDCTGAELLKMTRYGVIFYGCVSGCFGTCLYAAGLSDNRFGLGWVYNFMGMASRSTRSAARPLTPRVPRRSSHSIPELQRVTAHVGLVVSVPAGTMIGSAVWPVAACILMPRMTALGAVIGAWGGMILAIVAWIATAATRCSNGMDPDDECAGAASFDCDTGTLDIGTLGNLKAQLAGSLTALGASFILSELVTAFQLSRGTAKLFDWEIMKGIKRVELDKDLGVPDEEMSDEFLGPAQKYIFKYGMGYTIFLIFIWPLAVITWGVFTKSMYVLWASVVFMWGYAAAFAICAVPIWESWDTISAVLTCKKTPVKADA